MRNEEILTSLINTKSDVSVQNTFMRLKDREAAVSLYRLETEVQDRVFSLIPDLKAERIRSEMRLFKRQIRIPEEKYSQIISHVIAVLQGKSRGNISSYVRPGPKT